MITRNKAKKIARNKANEIVLNRTNKIVRKEVIALRAIVQQRKATSEQRDK